MWCTAVQDTDTLHSEQLGTFSVQPSQAKNTGAYIVRSIAVIIHAAEKGGGGISANVLS